MEQRRNHLGQFHRGVDRSVNMKRRATLPLNHYYGTQIVNGRVVYDVPAHKPKNEPGAVTTSFFNRSRRVG